MTIALIDGDVLAYFAAYESVKKFIDPKTPIQLDENGRVMPLPIDNDKSAEILFEALLFLKRDIEVIKNKLYVDEALIAVKGDNNYRDIIYDEYKSPRHKRAKTTPVADFARELRTLLELENLAFRAHGREADDMLRTWANQCRLHSKDFYICSVDKDLKCIPGKFYNLKTKQVEEVSEEYALRFFYIQLLQGDASDNIPGLPGIGPKKAEKLLDGIVDEEEMQEVVVSQYIEHFEEAWYDFLMANGKLLHIQNHPDDYFSIRGWPVVKELL